MKMKTHLGLRLVALLLILTGACVEGSAPGPECLGMGDCDAASGPAATLADAEGRREDATSPGNQSVDASCCASGDAATAALSEAGTQSAVDAGRDAGLVAPLDAAADGASDGAANAADAAAGDAGSLATTWSALNVMKVTNPMDHGAVGNGSADDLPALKAAVNALPTAGGIVFFPAGKSFKKSDLLIITKHHVKLWSINRAAELFQAVNGVTRKQSVLFQRGTGGGVFGLKLRSDASARFSALEDNQIAADHASLIEIVGNEVQGSAGCAAFLYGSKEHYIEGNYSHHTWADHIHHTDGATASWVWGNYIFNENPSKGDDGVACVTYGPGSARCGDMEWFGNVILHTEWGRGYAVIGGNDIMIHHNWAIEVDGAGIIVASEPKSSFNSASSQNIQIFNNYVKGCGHGGSHPNILISGDNPDAAPLTNITLTDNVSVQPKNEPYRAEGRYEAVTNQGLKTALAALPMPIPGKADIKLADTSVLRTRDVSHAPADKRAGLYRIHVRPAPGGAGYQQRFEYMIKGPSSAMGTFLDQCTRAGAYLSERKTVHGTDQALLLSPQPIALPADLVGISFRELRSGDRDGSLSWLWRRVDTGDYE